MKVYFEFFSEIFKVYFEFFHEKVEVYFEKNIPIWKWFLQ